MRSRKDINALESNAASWVLPHVSVGATQMALVLHDLKVPKVASFALNVYVHPRAHPFAEYNEADRRFYHTGPVTMWKAHAHDGDHGHADARRTVI